MYFIIVTVTHSEDYSHKNMTGLPQVIQFRTEQLLKINDEEIKVEEKKFGFAYIYIYSCIKRTFIISFLLTYTLKNKKSSLSLKCNNLNQNSRIN